MSELVCPKCESPMRSYERSGITIDQCTGCRSVFLDRGELERLVDAEGSFYEERGFSREAEHDDRDYREEHRYQEYGHKGYGPKGYGHDKPQRKRKKESFLSDFLDF
jgi:uncharacterized protein